MQNKTAHHLTIHHLSSTDICTVHDRRAVVFAKAKLLVWLIIGLLMAAAVAFPCTYQLIITLTKDTPTRANDSSRSQSYCVRITHQSIQVSCHGARVLALTAATSFSCRLCIFAMRSSGFIPVDRSNQLINVKHCRSCALLPSV